MAEIAVTAPSLPARMRAIFGGAAGNLVEWYDWYAYAAFTLYFAKSFFPQGDQTSQLLQAAGVFAVGFFARPVGAWARKASRSNSFAVTAMGESSTNTLREISRP